MEAAGGRSIGIDLHRDFCEVAIAEGDEIAGFRVIVPGHAPGVIALFRDPDQLALVPAADPRAAAHRQPGSVARPRPRSLGQ